MKKPRLITIPLSHYCEKARWALERAQIEYEEDGHLQAFHLFPVKRMTKNDTVPVLVVGKQVFDDSTLILKWVDQAKPDAGLYPKDPLLKSEVEAWEEDFDQVLGPAVRVWVYFYILDQPGLVAKYGRRGIKPWQKAIFPVVLPVIKRMIRSLFRLNPGHAKKVEDRIQKTLDRVTKHLEGGRQFLVGDSFTAADLTFAALSAPIFLPENYGVPLPQLSDFPSDAAQKIEAWRNQAAGRFTMRLYREFRN